MWKKNELDATHREPAAPTPAPIPTAGGDLATIGPSIVIKGDLTGDEDLMIQGRIEGNITLRKHNVTVGKAGRVKADIYGRSIRVEGEVRGNLYGEQDVVIRASGRVQGNLVAPRVTLENGSKFKGSIDMEPAADERSESGGAGKGAASPAGVKPAALAASPTGPRPAAGLGGTSSGN